MMGRLQNLLSGLLKGEVVDHPESALQLACTVLMYEVLRADMQAHERELEKIRAHVQCAFDLDLDATAQLMEKAKATSEEAISLHELIRAINDQYAAEDKKQLIKMLWDIAYADGELDPYEEHMIRKLADWLYVPHRAFIQTKHEAM